MRSQSSSARLHRSSNFTIVLIEHDMRVVFHLADKITVLDQGRLLAEGTPQRSPGTRRCAKPIWAKPHERVARGRRPAHLVRQSHILHGVS